MGEPAGFDGAVGAVLSPVLGERVERVALGQFGAQAFGDVRHAVPVGGVFCPEPFVHLFGAETRFAPIGEQRFDLGQAQAAYVGKRVFCLHIYGSRPARRYGG
jgi:hypothetical protein